MSARVHAISPAAPPERFALGDALVDLNLNEIVRGKRRHRITPKAAAVLGLLAGQPGRAVARDDLLSQVWADAFPTDDVLSHAIAELRRALGDSARNSRWIETIPKVGYRLVEAPEPAARRAAPRPGQRSPVRPGLRLLAAFALGTALGAGLTRAWLGASEGAPAGEGDPLDRSFPVSAQPGPETMPALSDDGRQVAFVAAPAAGEPTDILVKPLLGEATLNVTQTQKRSEYAPVWAPDGERLAFLRFGDGGCRVIVRPASGGLERELASCLAEAITYVDWSPDGRSLALTATDPATGMSRIRLVDVDSGTLRALDYPPADEHDVQPKFSPDGAWLLFRRGANPRSELHLVASAGGPVRSVAGFGGRVFGFDWLPDSRRFWFCAQREGVPMLYEGSRDSDGLRTVSRRCAIGLSIAAAAGTAAFEDHAGDADVVELALAGAAEALFPSTRDDRAAAYAPAGDSIVFVSDRSGEDQLWLGERGTGEVYQLTRLAGLSLDSPRFSPDGEVVVFVGRGGGRETLYQVSVRSGIVERVSRPDERVRAGTLGPDGAHYLASDRSGSWQLWRVGPAAGDAVQLTRGSGHRPVVPGDGHVYYTRLDRYGVWRVPVGGGKETLVSARVTYANHETWRVQGGWIYLAQAADAGETDSVEIVRVRVDEEKRLERLARYPARLGRHLADVAPDGTTLLFTARSAGRADIVAVTGL